MQLRNIFSSNATTLTAKSGTSLFSGFSRPAQPAAPVTLPAGDGRMGQMSEMLQTIGATYSVPFILFYKGYDYNEIAAKLDIPVGSVKSRIFSARLKMKQMIAAAKQN